MGEGTSKAVEAVGVKLVVIFQELSSVVFEAGVPPSHENVPLLAKGVCPWHFCFVNDIFSFDKKFFEFLDLVCY